MSAFDGEPQREEFSRRIATIRRIVETAHPDPPLAPEFDISREARGVAIVLLFASYENLLVSLCRSLLDAAKRSGLSNRDLRAGFRLFAIHGTLQGIGDTSLARIWKDLGPALMATLDDASLCTLDAGLFPADGSFMKSSQVHVFCGLFELGDPGPVLKEVWSRLDTVVTQRNAIAHGLLSPEEVGRGYTVAELRSLVHLWQQRWTDFIDHVERKATTPGFFHI